MNRIFTLIVVLTLSVAAQAQYSLTRQDVNPANGSNPGRFTTFLDKTYFVAGDGTHGYELWWSDGHSYSMVADINPGSADGIPPLPANNPCVLGNKLYFPARDSAHGVEIYEYDGVNPPRMIADMDKVWDIRRTLAALDGWLYFFAATSATGGKAELYRYHPATHFYEQVQGNFNFSSMDHLVPFNGKLLFIASSSNTGVELYEYDPSNGAIMPVADINPGAAGSFPGGFYVYKNELFFIAMTQANGLELYRYNGFTPPRRITDIMSGAASSFSMPQLFSEKMAVYNNKLYFLGITNATMGGLRQLYSYDPVTDAVQMVKQVNSSSPAQGMAVYGGKLYIAADSNSGQSHGLYVFDGDSLRHLSAYGFSTFGIPYNLTVSNGRMYFSDLEGLGPFVGNEPYVLTDSIALGIKDASPVDDVMVYPNPASIGVTVAFTLPQPEKLSITLTDIQGRVVYATGVKQYEATKHDIVIPMQQLASGNYIYSVKSEEGAVLKSGKLVKE